MKVSVLFNYKDRLFCPGPTPTPQDVVPKLGNTMYHRQKDFCDIFIACRKKLAKLCNTSSLPVLLSSSGTGAMEATTLNFTTAGDQVMIVSGGKFGERFRELTETYGCRVINYEFPWGESPDLDKLDELLTISKDLKAFFIQANETSTGVHYPIGAISALVRKCHPNCLIVVDVISSLIAHELHLDKWDLDCVIGASQKGFGLPPGLAFIFLSARARKNFSSRPRFYFDLKNELVGQEKGKSQFTPPISIVLAFDYVLDKLLAIGSTNLSHRHFILAEACRSAVNALGLKLFAKTNPSNALTAMSIPAPLDAKKLNAHLKKNYRLQFAAGQGEFQSRILRISHLGFVDPFDVITAISGLELALLDFDYELTLGSGVSAALTSLRKLNPRSLNS